MEKQETDIQKGKFIEGQISKASIKASIQTQAFLAPECPVAQTQGQVTLCLCLGKKGERDEDVGK